MIKILSLILGSLATCFSSTILAAQPGREAPIDLSAQLASPSLATLRRFATHRHLFGARNRTNAIATLKALMIQDDARLANAAAVVCYLARLANTSGSGPIPWTFESDTVTWHQSWSIGLQARLEEGDVGRLVAAIESGDTRRVAWGVFAMARHRHTFPKLVSSLLRILRTAGPDLRVLAAQLLAQYQDSAHLPAILRARESCPRDLRRHYTRAILAYPWANPKHAMSTLPMLLGGLVDAELEIRQSVLLEIEKRHPLDVWSVRILLELLESQDVSTEGCIYWTRGMFLRMGARKQLTNTRVGFGEWTLPSLDRMLRDQARNEEVTALVEALGAEASRLMPALATRLSHPDWRDRAAAAERMSTIGFLDRSDLERLAGLLKDENETVRANASTSLASAGSRAEFAVDTMFEGIDAGDSSLARGLGQLAANSEDILHRLASMPPPKDSGPRLARGLALSFTGAETDPRVARWLAAALAYPEYRYPIFVAAQRLGSKDSRLVAALVRVMGESRERTDLYAAVCLARLGCARKRAIPVLLGHLRSDSSASSFGVHRIAITGLVAFPQLAPGIVEEISTHIITRPKPNRLVRNPNPYFNIQTVRALGSLGTAGAPAIPKLLAALRESTPTSYDRLCSLCDALGNIGQNTKAITTALRPLAEHGNDWVGKAARLALRKLGAK